MQFLIREMWTYMAAMFVVGALTMWVVGWLRAKARLQRTNENWQTRLRSVEDAANSRLRSAEATFNARLEQEGSVASALRTDLQSQKARATSMADEVAKWRSVVDELTEDKELYDSKLRLLDERLSVALDDADRLDVAMKRLQAEHDSLRADHASLQTQAGLVPDLEARIQELEGTVMEREARIRHLEATEDSLIELKEQLDLMEREHAQSLRKKEEEATRLRSRIGDLEPRAARVDVLLGQVAERNKAVTSLESRLAALDGCPDRLRSSQDELATLRHEAQSKSTRTDELAAQADALRADLEREKAQALELSSQLTAMREAHSALRAEAAKLKEQVVKNIRDDLKRIHGIGPKLETTLNHLGYKTYRQIANWNDEDIGRVQDKLGEFGDRIRRDDWIGQARRLQNETPGVDVSM